jgi:hypothetical protein
MLRVDNRLKKFTTFYETRRLIIVFTTACQCSILHRSVTFSQKRHSLFFSIHFTIISRLCVGLRSGLSFQIFYQNLVRISDLYCMFYILSLSLPPGYHLNNIRCTKNYEATRYLQQC